MATFKDTMSAYAVGRRANMEEWNTISCIAGGAIGFGEPVMPGSGNDSCVALDATNGRNVLGITEATLTLPRVGDAYAQYDTVAVCESGVIGVLLGSDVTRGAAARWDTVNKEWTSAAQAATVVTIPGAQFDEAGTDGSVGVVRYRRPVPSASVSGG